MPHDQPDAELRESAELFRLMLEGALDYALFMLTPDGHVASWNIGAQRIEGYMADQIIGQHCACFYTAEDIARGWPEQLLAAALADGRVEDAGWRVRKDGSRFWSTMLISTMHDADGRLRGFSTLIRDITASEQAEARLREQAMLLRQVSDAIIATDLSFTVTSWNPAAEALYGWPAPDVVGKSMTEVVPTKYLNADRQQLLAALFDQGRWHGEVIQQHKDGRQLSILSSVNLLKDNAGNPLGAVAVNRDITEHKQAEQTAEYAAERLRVLADASQAFAEVSNDYKALLDRVAQHMVEALGDFCIIRVLADDQQILPVVALYHYDPTDTEALSFIQTLVTRAPLRVDEPSVDQHVFQTGESLLVPIVDIAQLQARIKPEYRAGIERFRPHSMIVVALKVQKQAIGLLGLYRSRSQWPAFTDDDVTLAQDLADRAALAISNARLFQQAQDELAERRRAEQALVAERALLARRVEERTADLSVANAELARAARLKDEFLANMSHELRTPLNSILGRSQALQEQIYGPLIPKQLEVLHGVEESGRHLLALINDILDLSKIEAGKLDLQAEPINIDLLCRMSLRMVAQTAMQKSISVTSTVDSLVETIAGDERRLKQILVNLLSNAVKFTPEGGQVGLEVRGDVARQAMTFTVWDTGIGIAEADLARLFKPFMQIDSSLSRQYAGTGLGLALVLRLAQAHGGSVTLESTPGQGSRFSVTLPWQPTEARRATLPNTAAIDITQPIIHQALVIDDSSTAAEQLTRYLTELGARVEVHPQGRGALEQAIALQPDLIVLDILLPDLNGWEVLRQLKAEPRTQAIPVVIVSVVDEPAQARALGAAAFLLKPIDREMLAQTLRQALPAATDPPVHTALVIAPRAERPRILLAEDNELNIELLEYYLRAKGYDVMVARNGGEALLRAQETPPAVILMDIQMPGMDGLEAIRRIRGDTSLRHIPIVALTALAMPGDRERCLAAGADDYLAKPVDLSKLLTTIESQLNRRKE